MPENGRADGYMRDGERLDDLQLKGLRIIQNPERFCFGMDAVLLSDYAKVGKNSRVMDLCTGTGIVPILLDAKYAPAYIEGLEYQEACVDMARRSVRMNGQSGRIRIVPGDVKEVPERYPSHSFSYVTCNPPYMIQEHGLLGPNAEKAMARHEITCTLNDVVRAAAWLLKETGHFVMVHRPFRLAEIFSCLKEHRLEPKRMRLVHPYEDREPNMVLIDAVKGGRRRMKVDPPLIVFKQDGSYREEIEAIYGRSPGKTSS